MEELLESKAVDHTATMVKMVFDSWNTLIKQFNEVLDNVTDEQLQKQIAPNKNRGVYILGHMVAVHDDILPILGFGSLQFPEINEVFKSPDDLAAKLPSTPVLRAYWKEISAVLDRNFASMQPEQWFEKHNNVSAEDFAKQPHRNKLNVMITRTCHLSYHLGQMKWVQ